MNTILIHHGNNNPAAYNNNPIRQNMRIAGENLKIQVNDLVVNYDDNGPVYAPAIVFVHGTPFNKSIWDLQAEALKSNYRVVAYDLRGHGETKGPSSDLSVELLTEDLLAFLDALALDKVILCGHGLGGYVALEIVDQRPDRFNALVLAGVQCMEDGELIKKERLALIDSVAVNSMEHYADQIMKRLFASNSFVTRKEEVRAVRKMIINTQPVSVVSALEALSKRRESCSNLWSISMPVLLMVGREDDVTPVSVARFMRDNITGSQLYEIEYAGHLANLENTHEFNQHFKGFVNKVCQKKQLSRHCAEEALSKPIKDYSKKH